jgi:hypothetical protein
MTALQAVHDRFHVLTVAVLLLHVLHTFSHVTLSETQSYAFRGYTELNAAFDSTAVAIIICCANKNTSYHVCPLYKHLLTIKQCFS